MRMKKTLRSRSERDANKRRDTGWNQQGEPNIHTYAHKQVDDTYHVQYSMVSEPRPAGPQSTWVFLFSRVAFTKSKCKAFFNLVGQKTWLYYSPPGLGSDMC